MCRETMPTGQKFQFLPEYTQLGLLWISRACTALSNLGTPGGNLGLGTPGSWTLRALQGLLGILDTGDGRGFYNLAAPHPANRKQLQRYPKCLDAGFLEEEAWRYQCGKTLDPRLQR